MSNESFDNIMSVIGNTPLIKLKKINNTEAEVFIKLESKNPGGSIKDRIALSMIEVAEKSGQLKPGGTIIEPTSGNTGLGLAMICACKGYKLVLVMPDTMSIERRKMAAFYGAKIELTPGIEGMNGAIKRAEELFIEIPGSFMPQQFDNPANPRAHELTTGPEIKNSLGEVPDAIVAGIGTGGTITGLSRYFMSIESISKKKVFIAGVEPFSSAVISGGKPGMHAIQGIGAGFIPKVLDLNIIDKVYQVTDEAAYQMTKRLASEEGLLCGISTGAALYAALELAKELGKNKKIVVIAPDTGERYLSTKLFD